MLSQRLAIPSWQVTAHLEASLLYLLPSPAEDTPEPLGLVYVSSPKLSQRNIYSNIWRFRKNERRVGSTPPSLDLYYNVSDMMDIQRLNPNYLGSHGIALLQDLKRMRLDMAHERYENLCYKFVPYYESVEKFLRLVRSDADEVRWIRQLILVWFQRTGNQVTSSQLPSLF